MAMLHHVVACSGQPPVVFVHGFGCAHSDWDAQVAHLSPRYQTVVVDLRGHGASQGTAGECSIKGYGADVAEVMRALALPPAVLVGHSMGCRVVIEAALQAPDQTAAVILVDGSQFAGAMETILKEHFAEPNGYDTLVDGLFKDMFTAKSDKATMANVIERAKRLPRSIGEKMLIDLQQYDVGCLTRSVAKLHVPLMAVQTTYSNEQHHRMTMTKGQTTPYLDMLRGCVPSIRIEIIPETGHFPQLDESLQLNTLIGDFLKTMN